MNTNKYVVYFRGIQPVALAADSVRETGTQIVFENTETVGEETKTTVSAMFTMDNVIGYLNLANALVQTQSDTPARKPTTRGHRK